MMKQKLGYINGTLTKGQFSCYIKAYINQHEKNEQTQR